MQQGLAPASRNQHIVASCRTIRVIKPLRSNPLHMRPTVPVLGALLVLGAISCKPEASNHDSASASKPDSAQGSLTPAPVADTVPATPDVDLRTDKTRYRAGDSLTISFVNKSAATFVFNPCPRTVQRETDLASGRGWVPVAEPARMCTMEAWILKPKETRTAKTQLPDPLAEGQVRIVVAMTRQGPAEAPGGVHAVSAPITIVR